MTELFEKFSSRENLKKAYSHVKDELRTSSLSINPLSSPEMLTIKSIGDDFFIALEKMLRAGKYKPERGFFVYIPKDNLGLRPVSMLTMVDRIVYQAIFNRDIIGYKIDGQLFEEISFTKRINQDLESEQFLSTYHKGWNMFCTEQVKLFKKGFHWRVEVDVQQFYENIPIQKLLENLKTNFSIADDQILKILRQQLTTWVEYNELPKGIPQGPDASSVLSEAYLYALDKFVKTEILDENIHYLRYADDIVIMAETKEEIVQATQKIVFFLRDLNLNLNEKTKLEKLKDSKQIEIMRIISDYENLNPEFSQKSYSEIVKEIPKIIEDIKNGAKLVKEDLTKLKYFLKSDPNGPDIPLMVELLDIIPFYPSLTVHIIQYISDNRAFWFFKDHLKINYPVDNKLWEIYQREDITSWARFWILKLLASSKTLFEEKLNKEFNKILTSKQDAVFKIIGFYYLVIHNKPLDFIQVKNAIETSRNSLEKSLYSFFILKITEGVNNSYVKNLYEQFLDNESTVLNFMGFAISQNAQNTSVKNVDGIFANYLLNNELSNNPKIEARQIKIEDAIYFKVHRDNLEPFLSPNEIFGLTRPRKNKKGEVELHFPEPVVWGKVTLKLKEGLQDVEIFYDDKLIKKVSYIEFGFSATTKNHKPNKEWILLTILSYLQQTNITEATPNNLTNMMANNCGKSVKVGTIHTLKKTLAKTLARRFGTKNISPFVEDKPYYEPKFTILPEGFMRGSDVWIAKGRYNDNTKNENEENGVEEDK